jgi:hypothetical protein
MALDAKLVEDVAAERARQIAKGYDAAHDDTHICGEIWNAAQVALYASGLGSTFHHAYHPWFADAPVDRTPHEWLVIAYALIEAEHERLRRVPASNLARTTEGGNNV